MPRRPRWKDERPIVLLASFWFMWAFLVIVCFAALSSCASTSAFDKTLKGADFAVRSLGEAAGMAARNQCAKPLEQCVASESDPAVCEAYEICDLERSKWMEPATKILGHCANLIKKSAALHEMSREQDALKAISEAMRLVDELRKTLVDLGVIL